MAAKKTDAQAEIDALNAEIDAAQAKIDSNKAKLLEKQSTEIIACLKDAIKLAKGLTEVSNDAKKLLRELNKETGVSYVKSARKKDVDKVELLDKFLDGRSSFTLPELKTFSTANGFVFTSNPKQYYGDLLTDKAEVVDDTKRPAIWQPV
jgi:hypothetical protein